MKIEFDGFVAYAHSQDYKCSRGCAGCSSSERRDTPDISLDADFYRRLGNFLEQYKVEYSSISLNFCGDFLLRSPFFLESIQILMKYKILRQGLKILLYTHALTIEKIPKSLKILEKFQGYFTFQIGLPLHFSEDDSSLSRQLDTIKSIHSSILSYPHLQAHIVIQRSARSEYLSEENQRKLENIFTYFPCTLAENEGVYISYESLLQTLSGPIGIQKCPYLEKRNIDISEDQFSFYMLDISHEGIRPHGPGCEKNKNLIIGNLDNTVEELQEQTKRLSGALKKMQNDYDNSRKEIPLCQFCRINIGSYMNHS